jgi:uncharacterized protein DUF3300
MKSPSHKLILGVIAILGLALSSTGLAQQAQSQEMTTTTSDQATATLAPQELDALVAPIALYSDPLLAQTLAASTYPLEIIQLQQWMDRNKNLTGKALADAVAKQPWDPSVQGLVEFPDVIQRMAGNVQWTTDLGNAFLAQQSDVMDAVQRMRAKAQGTGNLKTSAQQVVKTETVSSGKQVIEIQQANPDVVYVPSYDPVVVYGAAPPAYPYYPYTYPGYVPGTALAWGAGIALGAAAWGSWGGHWGNCDWNGGNVKINNNYNYNKNNNFNRNVNRQGQGNWQHNPQHRGNAPYGNRQTANKYGGRGPGGAGGVGGAGRPGGAGGVGGAGRPGGAGGVGGIGGAGKPGGAGGIGGAGKPGGAGGIGGAGKPGGAGGIGGAGKPGGAGAGNRPGGGAGAGNKPGGGGAGARPGGGTAKNQVGNRTSSSRPSGGSKGGGFGGGGGGNYARASSNRGGQSMGGGGMSRGGGGHSGMSRGGGGGGRGGGGGGRGGGGRGGGGGGRRR